MTNNLIGGWVWFHNFSEIKTRKTSLFNPFQSNYIAKLNSIESFPWYIGQLPRQTAERQLLTQLNQIGSFLIRYSRKIIFFYLQTELLNDWIFWNYPRLAEIFWFRESESRRGDFSLSVRDNDSVKHYRIRKLDGNSGYYIAPRAVFPTLDLLVQHYQNTTDGLCCKVSCSNVCFAGGISTDAFGCTVTEALFWRFFRAPVLIRPL